MNLFETPFVAALNHLLRAESWARARLAPFAGETIELRAPPLPALRFAVAADGTLAPSALEAPAALVITLTPQALPAAMKGEDHLLRAVEVSGNAKLAAEVMFLARHLRWDWEEDAAGVLGDVAAHRLATMGRQFAAWHLEAGRRFAESLVEYALEERPLLVARADLEAHAAGNTRLRDALERLEKRIERLGG